jgi:LPS export ABC transporter protein LptC
MTRARVGCALFLLLVVAACKSGTPVTATQVVLDSADQVLIGMTHYVTEAGIQRARVRADTAYFFSGTQRAELRNVHVTFYDATGSPTSTLTAREGTQYWRTGDMEARGNVVLIRGKDGATMRTEAMRYSQAKNEVTSDYAFTFDSPTQHLRGIGFTSDPEFRNVQTKNLSGTGGQLVLPRE